MKITDLILEVNRSMYRTYVYLEHAEDADISDIANIIRGLDQVVVVNNKSNKEDTRPRALLQVKIMTTGPALESFEALKKLAMTTVPEIKKFQYSQRHIEQVDI